jgi:hypothetical protein
LVHAPLSLGSRSTSEPLTSLRSCASVIKTYICLCFLGILHIFARAKWLLLPALVFFINALAPFYTAPVSPAGFFWSIPGWYMPLIYVSKTACVSVQRSVCYLGFCDLYPPENTLQVFACFATFASEMYMRAPACR